MTSLFQKYTQRFTKIQHGLKKRATGIDVWRDWYAMLGFSTVVLLALFVVGAYTFFVTIKNIHPESENGGEYRPPTTKEELVKVTEAFRNRTARFESLRLNAPIAPDPGGQQAPRTKPEEVTPDTTSTPTIQS